MAAPINPFKTRLLAGDVQIGLWAALASPNATELLSHCGYDWLVADGEHSPIDIPLMLQQLQAAQSGSAHIVARVPSGEVWMVKQVLDLGAQTVLVPMIDTAEQAREMVRAMRYAPEGIRGMGALGRASRYGTTPDYLTTANAQTCLLVQVETVKALQNLEEICAVEGVDGVFIGPADLSADMGYPGDMEAPAVQQAIKDAIARINAAGKPAGILVWGAEAGKRMIDWGAKFVAVGHDVGLLREAALHLRRQMAD